MYKRQKNTYELVAVNTVLVDISTGRHPSAEMLIDLNDWENLLSMGIGRVGCCQWGQENTGYAQVRLNGKMYKVHRLLMPDSEVVDHINRIGTDNRRCNIRSVSQTINMRNTRTRSDNRSGVAGVYWYPPYDKWRARINFDGKRHSLGYFSTIEEAVAAREVAEKEHGYRCGVVLGGTTAIFEPLAL